jgi:hypothetical protein
MGGFPLAEFDNNGLFPIPSMAEMPMLGMFTEPMLFANVGLVLTNDVWWAFHFNRGRPLEVGYG